MYILEKGLSYQRLILVVQEKLDCPVSETGLSEFHGFKPLGQNLPIHRFSHFSLPFTIFLTSLSPSPFFSLLSLSLKNNREGIPKTPIGDPLVPPWNLRVVGWNHLHKNRCLRSPNRIFLISRYFHLIIDLFAPWIDLKFLWFIVFIHVIYQSPAISLSFIG
jgi:hypothetical protein